MTARSTSPILVSWHSGGQAKSMKTKRVLLIFIASLLPLVPIASAAELYFGAHNKEIQVGKAFEVGVFLNTQGQPINAIEG